MKLKPTLTVTIALAVLALSTIVTSSVAAEPDPGQQVLERIPHLKKFIIAKQKQARTDTEAAKETVAPEMWKFFELARTGQWTEGRNLWAGLARRSGQYEGSKYEKTVRTSAWSPSLEVELVLEAFASGQTKYAEAFGRGIVKSITRGAIFFGGTDPGRGLPTCFSESHIDADPFFTLTQNALADASYLEYLRRMYGSKIYIPTTKDNERAFQEYLADAQRRLEHDDKFPGEPKQLKPGEDVFVVDGRTQVRGQVAVMSVNGLLAKTIFDHNPDREFYIEESFVLDWMYPHLSPHGLIMKINHEPPASLSDKIVQEDHKFWSEQFKSMLGDWLTYDTPVQEVCGFAERVFPGKDLNKFRGDPEFVKNAEACKSFSKLRSSIGGMYHWRSQHTDSQEQKGLLLKEADFAFRQAFALCPYSPEAVSRYASLLLEQGWKKDAQALAATARKVDPGSRLLTRLQRQIETGTLGGKKER